MSSRGLSHGSSQMIPHSLALYEEYSARGENIYLDADDFSDIIHYYLTLKIYDEAEAAIIKGLAMHPFNWKILIEKAYLRFDQGDIIGSKLILEDISDPNEEEVILLRADILLAEDNVKDALLLLAVFENKISISTVSSIFYLLLDYDLLPEAETWLTRLQEKYANNVEVLALSADLYTAKSDFNKALTTFERLIEENPFNELYFWGQAKSYFETDKYDECVNSCLLGLAINDSLGDLYVLMGQAYFRLYLLDNAILCFQKACELSHKDEEVLEELIQQIQIDQYNISYYQAKGDPFHEIDEDYKYIKDGGLMSESMLTRLARTLNRAKYYPKHEQYSNLNIPHDIMVYLQNNSSEISGDVVQNLEPKQQIISEDIIRQHQLALAHQFGLVEDCKSQYIPLELIELKESLDENHSITEIVNELVDEYNNLSDELEGDGELSAILRKPLANGSTEYALGNAYILDTRSVIFLTNMFADYLQCKIEDSDKADLLLLSIGRIGFPVPVLEVILDLLVAQQNLEAVYCLIDEIQADFGYHKTHSWKKALVEFYNHTFGDFYEDEYVPVRIDDVEDIEFSPAHYNKIEKELRDMNLNFLADDFVAYVKQL